MKATTVLYCHLYFVKTYGYHGKIANCGPASSNIPLNKKMKYNRAMWVLLQYHVHLRSCLCKYKMSALPPAADQISPKPSTLSTLSSLVSLVFFLSLFPQCDWGGVVWGHRRQRVLQWSWRKVGSPIYCCCGYCAAACSEQVTLARTHTLTSDSKAQKEDDPFCAEKLRAFNDGGVAELAINRCHTKTHPFALSWPLLSSASFLHH